jgi:hypothetical protein
MTSRRHGCYGDHVDELAPRRDSAQDLPRPHADTANRAPGTALRANFNYSTTDVCKMPGCLYVPHGFSRVCR